MTLAGTALALVAGPALAADPCANIVGEVASIEGALEVRRETSPDWQPLAVGEPVCRQDTVRTGTLSRAGLVLSNDAVLRLDAETELTLADVAGEAAGRSVLNLAFGALQSFSRKPREIDVNAPHMVLAIRGTEFTVRADASQSLLAVQEGIVLASNDAGELPVAGGQSAVARPGEAPRPYLLVTPADAVQWALHYPAILLADAELGATTDSAAAIAAIDAMPGAANDAGLQVQRAALLLEVGQADAALASIDRALALEPLSGDAYALRAIVDVAQNRPAEARTNAVRAVELAPDRAAPYIALSYAEQAAFSLNGARDALLAATEREPENALAWARLSEVWLMLGDPGRSREAAGKAEAIDPELGRVQTVRGFANLAAFRFGSAREQFERAILLDPSDPLARFGLGLAQIRRGDLEGGRGNIETAVGLDPSNALLRTYLGKAYFEEKRDDLAGEQYDIARTLDPLDPTPWLYDAIRKQTGNRPVEALRDLERSIELNDNRAVYRSRQLLDQDRAARGTSLARIYNDLGFQQQGINEAGRSLTLDPGNSGAHRFLSDVYRDVRRTDVARVSELLQSQLLQDVNINPVQPSLSEANLSIVTRGGPAEVGFNEFTPLFERNRVQVNGSGVVGTNETLGGEGVVSALYDRFSISAGAFGFESDGWRDNNDIDQTLYNAYFQAALTEKLNAQFEYRRRETDFGDLDFNFDPDDFDQTERRSLNQDIVRFGLRYSPTATDDLILSYIYSDREATTEGVFFDAFIGDDFAVTDKGRDDGHQAELQHIRDMGRLDLISGVGFFDFDGDSAITIDYSDPANDIFDGIFPEDTNERQRNAYIYGNLNFPSPVVWTLGISYNDFEFEGDFAKNTVERFNPKLGVQWQVTDRLSLRAAAFRVVKPPLASNQTIEPTQVAGFNQLFDDGSGDTSTRYGIGVDHKLGHGVYVGAEATWRELDAAVAGFSDPPFVDQNDEVVEADEQTHRVYVNWTPNDRLALSTQVIYDRWETDSTLADDGITPEDLETWQVPVSLRYFHPNGVFGALSATYVNQEVERSPGAVTEDGSDSFVVVDAAIGYRFPKRAGAISLQVNNLFDTDFRYQDDGFREVLSTPSVGPYVPERQVMLRLALTW